MKREEIISKLKDAYKTVMGKEPDEGFSESADLRTDLGLTSVGMLYFVIVIETLFSVRFENVGTNDFKTLEDVISYIEKATEK